MKIAIDISSIVYGTGVSTYTKNLIRALAKIDKKNQYILFGGSLRMTHLFNHFFQDSDLPDNFLLVTFPFPPRAQAKIWNDWHILSLEKLVGSVDLYHSPDWSLAPTQAESIITVHDLFFFKHPDQQRHPYQKTLSKRLERARDKQLQAIAVSQTTKQDLVEIFDYPENLVTVIPEAADSRYTNLKLSDSKTSHVKKKHNLNSEYLLMVSTLEPRKNMKAAVEAFTEVVKHNSKYSNYKLAIAGKVGWGEHLQPNPHLQLLGYVPDDDLPHLYHGAQAFLYPSLYEGFGLPILAAMACGTPVLTSNISSMPEVAGDAALLVNPNSQDELQQGIQKMLNLTSAQRKKIVDKGLKRQKKFTWHSAAKKTLALYSKHEK